MKTNHNSRAAEICGRLDGRLAAYLTAAGAMGAAMGSEAQAIVVVNNAVQTFGVNGIVSIDFNSDGQTDFQIDHDRVTLPSGGPTLDYLQIDKNDINGESNPLDFDPITGFQAATFSPGATIPNDANESAYVINGAQGSYPAALTAGTPIGPVVSTFDFQESNDFQGGGKDIRANRVIDEDATQIDKVLGGQAASGVQVPFGNPGGNFLGLGGQVRYLGLKMDLNNMAATSAGPFNYGWIGVRITNEADATGEVVGWGYQTTAGKAIGAGAPEPSSLVVGLLGAAVISWRFVWKRVIGR